MADAKRQCKQVTISFSCTSDCLIRFAVFTLRAGSQATCTKQAKAKARDTCPYRLASVVPSRPVPRGFAFGPAGVHESFLVGYAFFKANIGWGSTDTRNCEFPVITFVYMLRPVKELWQRRFIHNSNSFLFYSLQYQPYLQYYHYLKQQHITYNTSLTHKLTTLSLGVHGFDSYRGPRCFLCPTLVSG